MYQPLIVSGITFLITSVGTLANIAVFISTFKISSMKSSFGTINKNQAVCNTIMCLIFLLYVCPMQFSDSTIFIQYSHILGASAMAAYEISHLSHLLTALNRFCAVFFPFYYEKLFSKIGTIIMIQAIWIVSIIFCVLFYEIIGCLFTYDDVTWTFGFLTTQKCSQLTWYTDFILNTVMIIVTIVVNLLTAFKAGKNSRSLMNAAGIQMSRRQKQRELGFIKQTFLQGISMFAGQFTYYLVAPLLSNPVLLFLLASLWAFMHAVDGLIILISNKEMLEVCKLKSSKFSILMGLF
ncbi:G-protein coupled receptors family 1 profile domain-containing protein [Caenorhabditis elegans]|uniref:G-protein coupled receptors family 1 profile domain-containing protein n=1 Tax=Caenorhabditis elegans TaxID=6239 RepID=O45309_CAEEL|nr:G-protein coupled receptors family 1 profile domain-containing protein [Caenorhabditis elegans]CAB03972.2 G-protein coupled receptors family 1 profile domain-containing protein [Caenorhabditis elegans]|eukprot:NP_507493.2 Serpentine Receptor, class X [Caenorhabditis elegans]